MKLLKSQRSSFVFLTLALVLGALTMSSIVFADDSASAPTVVAPAQPAAAAPANSTMTTAAAPAGQQQPSLMGMAMPFVIMLGIMYFLMIRPQQKKVKEHQAMVTSLKAGDEVVTSSGIIGTIAGMSEKVVTLEVAKNVQLKILKSQVNQVVKGTINEIQA